MTRQELTRYQRQLVALARRLGGEVRDLWEESPESEGEGPDTLSDTGDIGSHEYEEQITHALAGNEEALLGEVNAALDRLANGTFGQCVTCREPIGAERLRAVPYARVCIACARHEEASR